MNEALFSPSWYRVAQLTPRLRGHTQFHRHDYRGEVWYVLQDHAKGRFYRFAPPAYQVLVQMDGHRTVQDLWEQATERFGDDAPTQGDMIQLLSQLHAADILICDVPPDTAELLRRSEKVGRARWKMNLRSPLALRFPLVDPDRFLARTLPFARPFFGILGGILWIGVVGTAAVLSVTHWPDLTRNVVDRVLSAQNLLALWLIFPVIKALHELGHGYALKKWGAECHEMGIMLLVLTPIPYVDASSSAEFRAKYRRVFVGAAGIAVELFIASFALFAWLNLQPGLWRSAAYNVLLIGSVSTVLFNANPLLRYDGYYILADLVEIPNLAQRAVQYMGYLLKHYLFRVKVDPPSASPGERFWFVFYSLATFCYRFFIYAAIFLFIAGKFFIIGILLAIWAISTMVIFPVLKGVSFLATSPVLREKRPRAVALSALLLVAALLLLFAAPFPLRTVTEGVIWVPEESLVRARTDGFVARVVVPSGTRVTRGEVLVEGRDPFLDANARVLRARLEELQSRYDAAFATDKVQVQVVREEMEGVQASLNRAEERLRELNLVSPSDGVLILPDAKDLPDLHLKQGDLVGYVLDVDRPTIRVVVPQSSVDLVRRQVKSVQVRMADRLGKILHAKLLREVPEGLQRLPSTILGRAGGGQIPIDPFDKHGTKTFENLFQFDIQMADVMDHVYVGARAYVRFDHGTEPAGFQLYRALRQLFLKRFNA